jgi:hypothetical protein
MKSLRTEMLRAAKAYYDAMAAYCQVLSNGEDLEDATQHVLGVSLRYRVAIDALIASTPEDTGNHRRLHALRAQLDDLSRRYNTPMKRANSFKREGDAVRA